MLDLTRTRIVDSVEFPLSNLVTSVEEGQALGLVIDSGSTFGSASVIATTAATDRFLGIAFNYFQTPTTSSAVEVYTIPSTSPYTVSLANTPTNVASGAGLLVKDSTGQVYAWASSGPTTNQYSISTNVLTFNAAKAGVVVTVQYVFTLSVVQALQLVGSGVAGGSPNGSSFTTNSIGIIRRGIIYTSNFNTGVDWAANKNAILFGNAGKFDITGNTVGPAINGYVVNVPNANAPFLGVYIDA